MEHVKDEKTSYKKKKKKKKKNGSHVVKIHGNLSKQCVFTAGRHCINADTIQASVALLCRTAPTAH